MLGGRLPVTGNKRICQISGQKSGRGRLRNLRGGRLRESSCKRFFTMWFLTVGGRLREVVAMRELTVINSTKGTVFYIVLGVPS